MKLFGGSNKPKALPGTASRGQQTTAITQGLTTEGINLDVSHNGEILRLAPRMVDPLSLPMTRHEAARLAGEVTKKADELEDVVEFHKETLKSLEKISDLELELQQACNEYWLAVAKNDTAQAEIIARRVVELQRLNGKVEQAKTRANEQIEALSIKVSAYFETA